MTIKAKLDKLENIIKVIDESNIAFESLGVEERRARIATYICRLIGMDIEAYWELPDKEREQLHSDILIFLRAKRDGKSIEESLEILKLKNPNYRKELEQSC